MRIDNAVYNYEESDISFIGLPVVDSRTPNPLSEDAPSILRKALNNKDDYDPGTGLNAFDKLRIHDAGDKNSIKPLMKSYDGQKLFILGGEHSVTKNAFRELNKEVNDLHLIVFDAHLDVRREGEDNATWLREVIESGADVSLIGQRCYSREEDEFIKEHGLIINKGLELEGMNIYVSFDIDVLDSVFAPTCSTPEPFGENLTYYNNLLTGLVEGNNLIGIDFVEFAGRDYDVTYSNTASLIMNVLKTLLKNQQV